MDKKRASIEDLATSIIDDTSPLPRDEESYRFTQGEIISYADACAKYADYIIQTQPDSIICPLRGGYPPTQVITNLTGDEYEGQVFYVPTSNFVRRKNELIRSTLENAVIAAISSSSKNNIHLATIDTAKSGTSTRKYNDLLKIYLPQIKHELRHIDTIDYSLLKIWHKPEQVSTNPKHVKNNMPKTSDISIFNHALFVYDWLSEDDPELLGIDYPYYVPDMIGIKKEHVQKVDSQRPIQIVGESHITTYSPQECQTTAELLVDIITTYAKGLMKR